LVSCDTTPNNVAPPLIINVDEKDGRMLFYYFVEATADAAKSLLILLLNGSIFRFLHSPA
jgi:hypothetical protein